MSLDDTQFKRFEELSNKNSLSDDEMDELSSLESSLNAPDTEQTIETSPLEDESKDWYEPRPPANSRGVLAPPEMAPKEDGFQQWLLSKKPLEGLAAGVLSAATGGVLPASVTSKIAPEMASDTGLDALQGFGRGATYGFQDELEGVLATVDQPHPFTEQAQKQYVAARDSARARQDAASANSPIASTLGQIAGAVMTPGPKGSKVGGPGVSAMQAARQGGLGGLIQGGLQGGAYGLGESKSTGTVDVGFDTILNAALGALTGGATGAALGGGGQGLRNAAARRALGALGTDTEAIEGPVQTLRQSLGNPNKGPEYVGLAEQTIANNVLESGLDDTLRIGEGLIERGDIGSVSKGNVLPSATTSAGNVRNSAASIVNDIGYTADDMERMVTRAQREAQAAKGQAAMLPKKGLASRAELERDSLAGQLKNIDGKIEEKNIFIEEAERYMDEAQRLGDTKKYQKNAADLAKYEKERQELMGQYDRLNNAHEDAKVAYQNMQNLITNQRMAPISDVSVATPKTPLDELIQSLTSNAQSADKAAKAKKVLGAAVSGGLSGAGSFGPLGYFSSGSNTGGLLGAAMGGLGGSLGAAGKVVGNTPAAQSTAARALLPVGKVAQTIAPEVINPNAINPAINKLVERLMGRAEPKTPEQMKEENQQQNDQAKKNFTKGTGG